MSSSSPDHQQNPSWHRTVLLATASSQSIIAEVADGKTNAIAYSAYGEQSAQQEVATQLGFNGQLREARTGWYLLGNGYRAYNPRLMRFHSPDSWSPFGRGGLNPYMYCVGDPVNRSDPTGHISFSKFLGRSFDFFFGGADVTGPSRQTRHQAAIVEKLGGMRPENTGEGTALATAGIVIAVNAPIKKTRGLYPGGDIAPQGVRGWEPPPLGQGTPWRVSSTAQDSHSFGARHQAGSSTGRPTEPGSPPSYDEAMSGAGMRLWTKDTFAQAQPMRTVTVFTQANPRQNFVQPPPQSAPPPPPAPPPEYVNPRTGMTAEQARIRHGQAIALLRRARNE